MLLTFGRRVFRSSSGTRYLMERYEEVGVLKEWFFYVGPRKFFTISKSCGRWILDKNSIVGDGNYIDGTKRVEIECLGVRDTVEECLDLLESKGGKKA